MKCIECLDLLAEHIDGELIESEAEQVSGHLMKCAGCAKEFELLTAEQELFARYDRELEITPAMWSAVQSRTALESSPAHSPVKSNPLAWLAGLFAIPRFGYAFSGALAVLVAAVVLGVIYFRTQPKQQQPAANPDRLASTQGPPPPPPIFNTTPGPAKEQGSSEPNPARYLSAQKISSKPNRSAAGSGDQSDILFSDIAYSETENKDTADHIAQAQNLLRTIRSLHPNEGDEVDVTFEKAMSRRLLDENVVLRRDAETSGKYPVKALLGDLEPFLIDIANLPDKSTLKELRVLNERAQKTEIVAALQSY